MTQISPLPGTPISGAAAGVSADTGTGAGLDEMMVAQLAGLAAGQRAELEQQARQFARDPHHPRSMLAFNIAVANYTIDASLLGALTKKFVTGVESLTKS
ncbi:hypothetical protein [Burkholderia ambifaria]|uniref:hypothetical protein n=1 Tax=Burkholderia ambifaria TaxID=152480 RepID=UPI0015919072|nr:hypothetical protein [Burkholderia ambifaria]